ncbi:MAG: ADP-ribosylglycohydrolase family protein [Duncaniella dubosii]|nr:ADP-ribosylglycohydrolase family protein [Duncaniella dubosii]
MDMLVTEGIYDRMMGCLYGNAIGDALGLGAEFMSRDEVRRFYPQGLKEYCQIVQDDHRRRWSKGAWTDDTDMMLCLLGAFGPDGFNYRRAAKNFKDWYEDNPVGIGRHIVKVLMCGDYTDAPFEASKIMWESTRCNSAANGTLMRTSVMGLWNPYVQTWVDEACMLTHYDPRCVISCRIASVIIHNLVWADKTLSKEDILEMTTDSELVAYIDTAYFCADIAELKIAEQPGIGYTYRTLAAALWCYWHSESFESGLLAIVNEGGDADTNAAVACAILGAKFGFGSIPAYYIDNLHNENEYRDKCESFVRLVTGG